MRMTPGDLRQNDAGLNNLLHEIHSCSVCAPHLPLGPNPVIRAHPSARILLVGQAPGTRVHATGIPWNDPSGDKLREWLAVSRDEFYDENIFAIILMGFCYPGRGKGGDKPPRPECAPLWHAKLHALLPQVQLTLLIGAYAIARYLPGKARLPLTECIKTADFAQSPLLPIVHPSPRNKLWLKQNPWFESGLVPVLQKRLRALI
ncbi:MAG: uracil-DNA glycosylase family protein [Spirochaetota bacterium]